MNAIFNLEIPRLEKIRVSLGIHVLQLFFIKFMVGKFILQDLDLYNKLYKFVLFLN